MKYLSQDLTPSAFPLSCERPNGMTSRAKARDRESTARQLQRQLGRAIVKRLRSA
jgi:hypothetical protein